ncbi:sigma-70 family RNA polymerase sigma factor [Streptomyces sp. NPDC127098]|uniref:sigma-70 family RNA polymerase sigma factor n=1 Tax=Streptomyces sp. NPDC127098 TaxID=3347137 RepID=UPI003659D86E
MVVEGQDDDSKVPRQRPRLEAESSASADLALVDGMRRGDPGAYDELYRRHADAVRRYARTCCRDTDTADDLTNEVFAATLQAVRRGAGPDTAVRAYLLTSVRRVAADWARTAKREQLVEDFAAFAVSAAAVQAGGPATHESGADVRAMRQAEESMAVRAFRSLPERWQTVLWHTAVEDASPRDVAPLLGLTPNATAVLAHRAREGLKQAYLQAHVSRALTDGGDCARFADRLGAYARGGLRTRAERGLRKHLEECARCAVAASEVRDVNAHIRAVLPIAVIGWFAADSSLKGAALWLGAAGAGATAGSAAAAGGAGGGAAAEGLGAPVKAGIASGVVVSAVAAVLAMALLGSEGEDPPEAAAPDDAAPAEPEPRPEPTSEPVAEPEPLPLPEPTPEPSPSPSPSPPPSPEPVPPPPPPSPEPSPSPTPEPAPPPPAPEPLEPFELRHLAFDVSGDDTTPTVRLLGSSPVWQRDGLTIGGRTYEHGITVGAWSSVTIDLNLACVTYQALVGVDDLAGGLGAAVFSVYGDDRMLWESDVVSGGDEAVRMSVPLTGVETLRLDVHGEGWLGATTVADWADSEITCE